MTKLKYYSFVYWLGIFLYLLVSYLTLLRDSFMLERLGITLGNSSIETTGLTLADTLKVNYSAPVLLLVALLVTHLAYLGIVKHSQKKLISLKFLVVVVVIIFVSFPSLSTDIFDYNNTNRIAFDHQANPWIHSASDFPEDSEIYYGSWLQRASVYPPISAISASLVGVFFGTGTIGAIVGFKGIALLYYCLVGMVLVALLPKDKHYLVNLFLLNPLVLVEFIGNAHNDLLMAFLLLLGLYYLHKKKLATSGLMFALSILSKFSVILYLPFIAWMSLKRMDLSKIIVWTSVIIFTSLVSLLLMGNSLPFLLENLQGQFSIYQKSVPTVLRFVFIQLLGEKSLDKAGSIQKLITLPTFGFIAFYYTFKTKNVLYDLLTLLMMWYLWIQAPMLQPWYIAWFLVLVPLLKNNRIRHTAIIFSFSALVSYPIYYLSLLFSPQAIVWQLVLALVVILPPMVTLYIPIKWYTRILTIFRFI